MIQRIIQMQSFHASGELAFIDRQNNHIIRLFAFAGMASHKIELEREIAILPIFQ
ncbi:Uncharacterised protein [Vibrio cholerae]|nr:Uncharacterised protein [Vibrio cholerae]